MAIPVSWLIGTCNGKLHGIGKQWDKWKWVFWKKCKRMLLSYLQSQSQSHFLFWACAMYSSVASHYSQCLASGGGRAHVQKSTESCNFQCGAGWTASVGGGHQLTMQINCLGWHKVGGGVLVGLLSADMKSFVALLEFCNFLIYIVCISKHSFLVM